MRQRLLQEWQAERRRREEEKEEEERQVATMSFYNFFFFSYFQVALICVLFLPTFSGGCPGEGEKEEGGGGGEDEPGEGEEGFSSGETEIETERENETETETENETETEKRREECRLLVPGVPEAPSGGAEGGEEEVAGGFAEAEGDKQACKVHRFALKRVTKSCAS